MKMIDLFQEKDFGNYPKTRGLLDLPVFGMCSITKHRRKVRNFQHDLFDFEEKFRNYEKDFFNTIVKYFNMKAKI